MAGIYIHIPFCSKACHYCDFHFSTSLKKKTELVDAIRLELFQKKDYLTNNIVSTIYFGGGTPSLLNEKELDSILEAVFTYFSVESSIEITLEANPDDLTQSKLSSLKKSGVNRLSIGIQSFDDEILKWMNRSHEEKQAIESVKNAQDVGIANISIDLIYGIPNMTLGDWENNLVKATQLNVQHISSYGLTVEEKTVLAHKVKRQYVMMPDDAAFIEQFKAMIYHLTSNGFEHYEISNFAKEGFISKHNSSYWKGTAYLGIGPSAHSYNGKARNWNVSNNTQYIKAIKNNSNYQETEIIDSQTAFNEHVLTRLRTKWGISRNEIKELYGEVILKKLDNTINPYIVSKEVRLNENIYYITETGKMVIDAITSDLFVV